MEEFNIGLDISFSMEDGKYFAVPYWDNDRTDEEMIVGSDADDLATKVADMVRRHIRKEIGFNEFAG